MAHAELIHTTWEPFSLVGITHPFLTIQADVVIATWVVLAIFLAIALIGRWALTQHGSLVRVAFLSAVRQSSHLLEQTSGERYAPGAQVYFITTLFVFILICNWLILVGFEEPTSNYNTTAALAITSFIYIQYKTIQAHGILAYVREYLKLPFTIGKITVFNWPWVLIKFTINTVGSIALFPLELISKLASVVSLSFRLFGNILAGSIIASMTKKWAAGSWLLQAFFCFSGLNILILGFFVIFEGLIQAFVFTILTTTYLALGTQQRDDHE